LHALLLLTFSFPLITRRIPPPLQESVPVEIWTPEQLRELTNPAIPGSDGQHPPQPGTIRATRILSGDALAHPLSRKMREMLPLFEEDTRLEQLCDLEAMAQIAASLKHFQPDRVVAYAKADVRIENNMLVAEGAAFRSHRRWYGLTFRCGLSEDRQAVQSFEFSVSRAVPRRLWERYNLPDPALDTD
jgi:predicted house-cleaning noncanonical NTP pyrophosphatase (MazG superfamily)